MYVPSAYVQYVKFSGSDNGGDILAEHAYKGPLLRTIDELNAFVKVGIAQPHPVKVSALQEEIFYSYPDWAIRELLLNAIIHRDYQLGNAPIKFYDYNSARIELSNSGGLYGLAKPDNFPLVNDYRNPLLAGAMKVMGFVNQYNRGIAKVKLEMAMNGNPPPIFDVNKLTEFRVTLLADTKIQLAATQRDELNIESNTQYDKLNNVTETHYDELNDELNDDSRLNDPLKGTEYTSREEKILHLVGCSPGIQRKEMARKLKISVVTLDRILKKMTSDRQNARIEHRGSKKTGGWFRKT